LLALAKALSVPPASLLPSDDRVESSLAAKCKAVVDATENNETALGLMLDLLKVAHRHVV